MADDEHMRNYVLAHEYAHVALGPDWDALPYAVEEGLAHRIACETVPEHGQLERRSMADSILHGVVSEELSSDIVPEDWSSLGQQEIDALPGSSTIVVWGIGFVLVDVLSLEDLLALSVRAQQQGYGTIPRAWLLDLASPPEILERRDDPRERTLAILSDWIRRHPPETVTVSMNGDGTVTVFGPPGRCVQFHDVRDDPVGDPIGIGSHGYGIGPVPAGAHGWESGPCGKVSSSRSL